MMSRIRLRGKLAAALALGLALPAWALEYRLGPLVVEQPWARPSVGAGRTGAAYLTLHNRGERADRLVGASSPVAQAVELHSHTMEGDVMRMRAVPAVEVAPGEPVVFGPGGLHVMLIGLTRPLAEGERFPLTLRFEHGGTVAIDVPVQRQPAR